mgnify:CR=1 FL=1
MPLIWVERYNNHSVQVGTIGMIVCSWNPGYSQNDPRPSGYRVSFRGVALRRIIPDLETAKAEGIALAQRKLKAALAELGT